MIGEALNDDDSTAHAPSLRAALAFVAVETALCVASACASCRLANAKKKEIVERKEAMEGRDADQHVVYTLERGYHMASVDANGQPVSDARSHSGDDASFTDLRSAVDVGAVAADNVTLQSFHALDNSDPPQCDSESSDEQTTQQQRVRAQDAATSKSVTFSDSNEVVFLSPKRTCVADVTHSANDKGNEHGDPAELSVGPDCGDVTVNKTKKRGKRRKEEKTTEL